MTPESDAANAANDDVESLTKVQTKDLTRFERREVLPSCDFVVVGYDSSYSDKPESTKRIDDPEHTKNVTRHGGVRGTVVGTDHDDPDRSIGLTFGKRSGGTVYTSKASGRIGNLLWVAYPKPEPAKKTFDVTFRALADTRRVRADDVTDETVDKATEHAVDNYSYDGLTMPPRDERRVEEVQVDDGSTMGRDTQWKAAVDIPRTITVHHKVEQTEVVKRARKRIGSSSGSSYEPDRATWREDLPEIGEHVYERDQVGMNDRNLREAAWYWVEEVDVCVTRH